MNRYSYVTIKVYADRLQVWPVGPQFVVPGLITWRGGGVILFNKISVTGSGPSRTGAPGQRTHPRLSSFWLVSPPSLVYGFGSNGHKVAPVPLGTGGVVLSRKEMKEQRTKRILLSRFYVLVKWNKSPWICLCYTVRNALPSDIYIHTAHWPGPCFMVPPRTREAEAAHILIEHLGAQTDIGILLLKKEGNWRWLRQLTGSPALLRVQG